MKKESFIRSFGRIKSRKLSPNKQHLLQNILPQYEIKLPSYVTDIKNNFTKIYLEIGFGFGDFLFENAKNNPNILFIGCEPHINGVINLLSKLKLEPLDNIKVFTKDSRILLDNSDYKFDKIYILNPDPWPKTKHFKRRLINTDLFKTLYLKSNNDSSLIITTDDNSYKIWIMSEYFKISNLWNWKSNSKDDWKNFPKDWTKTKYHMKAELAKRENIFLDFTKRLTKLKNS